VGNAHIILRTIHRFWQAEEARNRPLLLPQQEELKEYTENCETVLKKLEAVLHKHGGLDEGGSLKLRVKYVWQDFVHDFASIRSRLQQSTGNLAVFHSMLT
jgi:hypothetical protein